MRTYLVIGSGLTGVACADALIQAGQRVVMLDVGRECDSERMAIVRAMSEREPEEWDPAWLRMTGPGDVRSVSGASRKLVYGSDFPYADDDEVGLVQDGVRCSQSWARGGLSNVWGAAMLPYRVEDTRDWPIAIGELSPHYRAIAELTGVCGLHDSLDELFAFDLPLNPPLQLSAQARSVLERLKTHREELRSAGFSFGQSRLAVRGGCRGCQQCLSGCPYDLIFRADHALARLQKNSDFQYLSGHLVEEVRHVTDGVSAICCMPDGSRKEVSGFRAFVAAGVIGTAKIVVQSLGLNQQDLSIYYHPYFLLPVFLLKSVRRPESEKLHTLAQVFLEIDDRTISDYTIHLQLYTYNPILRERLRALFGFASMTSRLAVIQGYLHSNEAGPIMARVNIDPRTKKPAVALRGGLGARTVATVGKVRRKLARHIRRLGFIPSPAMLQIGVPGDGNHIGATFPMSAQPDGHSTDKLGRLTGYPRLHIVDASVLPSLAATTLTFTAMANARRIGIEAATMDSNGR